MFCVGPYIGAVSGVDVSPHVGAQHQLANADALPGFEMYYSGHSLAELLAAVAEPGSAREDEAVAGSVGAFSVGFEAASSYDPAEVAFDASPYGASLRVSIGGDDSLQFQNMVLQPDFWNMSSWDMFSFQYRGFSMSVRTNPSLRLWVKTTALVTCHPPTLTIFSSAIS